MANDFTEKLFQSIDTIVTSRLQSLEYDQTIICEVLKTSNEDMEKGIYWVESQSAKMIAYANKEEYYNEGDFVHVLVPLGDYNQRKLILGKVKQIEEVVADTRPFETFAPVTENLNTKYDTSADEYTFLVNKYDEKIIFNHSFSEPKKFLGYNKLGIKLSIYANMKTFTQEVVSGKYRVKVVLKGINLNNNTKLDFNDTSKIVTLSTEYINMEDMVFINPYITSGYCNQEKVFDIKDYGLTSITISVVQQKTDEFKDQNGEVVLSDNFYIKFKNIYCALGYECFYNDIGKEFLYAYPVDGLKYDFEAEAFKWTNARLIRFKHDSHFMPYGENIDLDTSSVFNGWAVYQPDSANMDERFGLQGYQFINGSEARTEGMFKLRLNINKGLKENKVIFSIKRGERILSNTISFKNNDYVKNADLLDNIIGFTGKLSDNRENFNFYGLDNKLLNDYNENEIYYLIIQYNSINGRRIEENDIITWRIPSDKTMLVPYEPYDCKKMADGSFSAEVRDGLSLYRSDDKTFAIPFRIKNIYNQNFTNNTITCNLSFIDENSYQQNLEFSKSISFGFSGSEGSDYIYNLELYKQINGTNVKVHSVFDYETNFNNYTLQLKAYDYNMELVEFKEDNKPQYKWLKDPESSYTTNFNINKINSFEYMDRIVMAKHTTLTGEDLISYLPIGTFLNDAGSTEYNLEGCKTISYDYSGVKPYYYKGEYKLYKKGSSVAEPDMSFHLVLPSEGSGLVQIKNNMIKPYDIYVEGFNHFGIMAVQNQNEAAKRKELIFFPVIIIQGQYSAMTEYVKKPIQINEVESIQKPILGYMSIKKNGIVIGKRVVEQNAQQKDTIGLYHYLEGKQLFGLDDTNGLLVNGLDDNLITLQNGNLINFTLTNCTGSIANAKKLVGSNNSGLGVGSNAKPVYFSNGVPVECTTTFATSSQIQELQRQIDSLQRQINSLSN